MIVITTHAVFLDGRDIYGPPHAISVYLNKHKQSHIFIKHSLYLNYPYSLIEHYENGRLKNQTSIRIKSSVYLLRLFEEQYISFQTIKKVRDRQLLIIATNPVNHLSAMALKWFHIAKKSIYFSADFAISRFENPLMNRAYHWIDTLAQNNAQSVWSISKRIVAYRKRHGLAKKKNILVPNAPFFHDIKRAHHDMIRRHDLVVVSALEPGVAFEMLIQVVGELKKVIPDIRLILIGSGSKEKALKKSVIDQGLGKHIIFKGSLSHTEMFRVTTKCGIGIAFYDVADPNHFRYFSDPMKVRDYLASGLPVIVSGNSAIGEELVTHNAGCVVAINEGELRRTIKHMLLNKKAYETMRKNAINLAEATDAEKTLSKLLTLNTI